MDRYKNLKIIMKRINHTIRRKKIPKVKLVSLTSNTWYDSNGTPTSWTGKTDFLATGFTPTTGYLIKNVTGGTVTDGYYTWNTPSVGTWNIITGNTTQINQQIYDDFQLLLFLEATADEMGDMVDFDKNIQHNKISANFTYNSICSETGSTITINNTTTYQLVNIINANNTNSNGSTNVSGSVIITTEVPEPIYDESSQYIIIDGQGLSTSVSSFTVHWGDGRTSPIGINDTITQSFATAEERTIRIVFNSPYITDQVVKVVNCNDTFLRINTEDMENIQDENNNYINAG